MNLQHPKKDLRLRCLMIRFIGLRVHQSLKFDPLASFLDPLICEEVLVLTRSFEFRILGHLSIPSTVKDLSDQFFVCHLVAVLLHGPVHFLLSQALPTFQRHQAAQVLLFDLGAFTHDGRQVEVRRQVLGQGQGRHLFLPLGFQGDSEAQWLVLALRGWVLVKSQHENLAQHFLEVLFDRAEVTHFVEHP
jgi:hypothetical protein